MNKYLVVLLSAIVIFCVSSNAIAKKGGKESKGKSGEFKSEKLEKVQDANNVKDKQKKVKKDIKTTEDKVKDANDIAKGKDHKQQLKAVEDKLARETEKHNAKLAKLEKDKQDAVTANDTEKLAKIEQQIQKENDRFTQKTTKTEVKKSRVRSFFDRMQGKEEAPVETPTDVNS